MDILNLDLVIKVKNDNYFEMQLKQPIKTKFNLLVGDSATYKTGFIENIVTTMEYSANSYILDYNKNKIHIVTTLNELITNNVASFDLCICDEGISTLIHTPWYEMFSYRFQVCLYYHKVKRR